MGETRNTAATMPAKIRAPVLVKNEEVGDFIDSL
jgi:hypothetical protein